MKHPSIIWGLLLATTHLVFFLAARPADEAGESVPSATGSGDASSATKSRLRGEHDGQSHYSRLMRELDASDLKGNDYKEACEALLVEWMKRDLRGAMKHLFSPDQSFRYKAMFEEWDSVVTEALAEEMARQPLQVWDWIVSGSYGSNRSKLLNYWTWAMLRHGQREVVLACAPEGVKFGSAFDLSRICPRANSAEMEQVRRYLDDERMSESDRRSLADEYARRRVALAGGDISAIFDHETDPELRKSLLRSWVDREIGPLETADALARLEDLPAEMFPEALKLTAGAVGNNRSFDTGMAGVVEFLEEMERRDLWRHIPEDQIESLVGSLGPSANRSAMDPGEVLEHLGSIAREDLRKIALTQTGREWARYSKPEMILQHVETLPSGSDRDVFLSGILEGMFDEEVFKVLRERIEDPEIREKAPKKAPREAY